MHRILIACITLLCVSTAFAAEKPYQKIHPIPFTEVKVQDAFWLPRLISNYETTIMKNIQWCVDTGRIENFEKAAGLKPGGFEGLYFNDSDVYKMLEAVSYSLAWHYDPTLDKMTDEIIALIAEAQEDNGYLDTYFQLDHPDEKWTDLRNKHELYCAGHLIEAAVAHHEATGKRTLLDVAIKLADLIDSIFGPNKRYGVPGHEELELALVKLYHHTGEEKYLKLAQFFIDERGDAEHRELYGEYAQDHLPVRDQFTIQGHAVRAMYLFSGVADVAAITGDEGYFHAMDEVWQDIVSHKMYITGGIGVSGHGEGFSAIYNLPNENAYAETCASIALAFFNYRLNGLHADAKYMDVFEQVLYNGLLSGVSLDGGLFFYRNPLASRGPATFNPSGGRVGDSHRHRQDWFACACCPPNIARFFAKFGGYLYGKNDCELYINIYAGSETRQRFGDSNVTIRQTTGYPWNGDTEIHIEPDTPVEFTLALRIPSWCEEATLELNGHKVKYETINGYASIQRRWKSGDCVSLHLAMPIRRIEANPLVDEDVGHIALMRGPLLYCLEEPDNAISVRHYAVPQDAKMHTAVKPDLLSGITVIEGMGEVRTLDGWDDTLYSQEHLPKEVPFTAVPYYAWDNREPGEMVVWLPEHPGFTPVLTIAGNSRISSSHSRPSDSLGSINDQTLPSSSNDKSVQRFTWWDHKGTSEWVQYNFRQPQIVSRVEVYWYDDGDDGGCSVPQSWTLLYQDGEEWKPVAAPSEFGTETNRFNQVTFDAVETTGLRIEAQLQSECSAGIYEWQVF